MQLSPFRDFALEAALPFIPAIHGGHDGGEGLASLVDSVLSVISEALAGGSALLGGFALLGLNIHPMLVHFPIAFLIGYLALDVLGLLIGSGGTRQFAYRLLAIGATTAVLTVASGLYAAYSVPHDAESHQIMVWHQRAGYLIAGLSLSLLAFRRLTGLTHDRMALTFNQILNVLLFLGLVIGADLGATLVYGKGVAVRSATSSPQAAALMPSPTP